MRTPRRTRTKANTKPIAQIQLPTRFFEALTENQVELLHDAALQILSQTGVRFDVPAAVEHFRKAGAKIDGARVFIERDLVEHALSTCPSEYTLHARNPAHNVKIGGRNAAVMPGGGPPYVYDLDLSLIHI